LFINFALLLLAISEQRPEKENLKKTQQKRVELKNFLVVLMPGEKITSVFQCSSDAAFLTAGGAGRRFAGDNRRGVQM
jgi:hypothetical protein